MKEIEVNGYSTDEHGIYCFETWRKAPLGQTLEETLTGAPIPFDLVRTEWDVESEIMIGYHKNGKGIARIQMSKDRVHFPTNVFEDPVGSNNTVGRIIAISDDPEAVKEAISYILSYWETQEITLKEEFKPGIVKYHETLRTHYLSDWVHLDAHQNMVSKLEKSIEFGSEYGSSILYNILQQRYNYSDDPQCYHIMTHRGNLRDTEINIAAVFLSSPENSGIYGNIAWIPHETGELVGEYRAFAAYLFGTDRVEFGGSIPQNGNPPIIGINSLPVYKINEESLAAVNIPSIPNADEVKQLAIDFVNAANMQ